MLAARHEKYIAPGTAEDGAGESDARGRDEVSEDEARMENARNSRCTQSF